LIGGFAALLLLGPVLAAFNNLVVIKLLINAVAATLLWWPVQWVLLSGRANWKKLLPGAVLNGAGQALVLAVSGIYMPVVISYEAGKYGLIGIAVAVVSWLVILGLLLVLSAVFGAELSREPTRPETPT
jgi:membrane protein